MSLQSVAADFKRMTGLVDDNVVLATLNIAAREIWDAVDIPGELREVRVTTDNNRYVTLPSDAYRVRGVRLVTGSTPMELVPISNRYNAAQQMQNYWTWRQMYRTPLQTRITNATKLTFTARVPLTARCTITVGGPTSKGERVYETLVIDAGQRTVTSEECYQDVTQLLKDIVTNADILVTTAGTQISVMPNHVLAPSYLLIQVRENCATSSCSGCNCFDVLYKPVLPDFADLSAYWPANADAVLMYKALEHYYMSKEDMIQVAQAYAGKALSMLQQFQIDEAAGKTIRPNVQRSPFQTRTGAVL